MRSPILVTLGFLCFVAATHAAESATLQSAGRPSLWAGTVVAGEAGAAVAECTPGCDSLDLNIDLPPGIWNQKPGGVLIAIRWQGHTLGDNLRLYVYRNGALIAKSDGIISISQGVLLREPGNGTLRLYIAYDPDSPSAAISYEGIADVQYDAKPEPTRQLLPDLEARPQANLSFDPGGIFFDTISEEHPSCYETEVAEQGAQNCLRFDQIFANVGEGAVELRYTIPPGSPGGTHDAFQRIFRSDGTTEDVLAGQVELHEAHGHYHLDAFGITSLWSVTDDGKKAGVAPLRQRRMKRIVGSTLIREGEKRSFCLADTYLDRWGEKGVGPRQYNAPDCLGPAFSDENGDHYVQGITNGWGDIYDWYLPDQYLEVTGVPDGDYLLETIADPDNQTVEANDENNCIAVYIRLAGVGTPGASAEIVGAGPDCTSP
jgi:hypothetical protein